MIHDILPRSLRSRLLLTVLVGIGLTLGVTLTGFNVLLRNRLDADATQLVRDRAATRRAELTIQSGRIVPDRADERKPTEGRVWVYAEGRLIDGPRAATPFARFLAEAVGSLAVGPPGVHDVGSETRLAVLSVTDRKRRIGTVVAALSLRPYQRSASTALNLSLILAGAIFLPVMLGSAWLLRSALRPVARMTAAAAVWSDRDLDRRFALGEPHDELTQLASVLDGLLDRISASLRHERRFSAEMSHELRTPLAKITTEAELALRRDRTPDEYRAALTDILRYAGDLTRTAETLLVTARLDASPEGIASDPVGAAANVVCACSTLAEDAGIDVTIVAPVEPFRVDVDAALVERILQPVVENAVRYGGRRVSISFSRQMRQTIITICDDGPGVTPDERDAIFEPGVRGSARSRSAGYQGTGLGLSLARRLARTCGGDIEAQPVASGGRFAIALPSGGPVATLDGARR